MEEAAASIIMMLSLPNDEIKSQAKRLREGDLITPHLTKMISPHGRIDPQRFNLTQGAEPMGKVLPKSTRN